MQIELNLAIRASLRERYGLYWTLPLVLAAVGGLVLVVSQGSRAYLQYRRVHIRVLNQQTALASLEKSENELRKKLDEPENRGAVQKVRLVNALIERKRISFPEVTEQISRLLPHDVRLTGFSLSFDPADPEVRIVVVGKSQEAVEAVLKALQDSSQFEDAQIQSEDPEAKSSGGEGVAMALAARYVGRLEVPAPEAPTAGTPAVGTPAAATPAAGTPAADTPATGGFAVQVGAFSGRENADHLKALIEPHHSPVSVDRIHQGDSVLYRVRVGHAASVEAAEKLAQELRQGGLATDTLVVPVK